MKTGNIRAVLAFRRTDQYMWPLRRIDCYRVLVSSFKLSAWWCCSQVCLTDLAVVSEALQLPLQRWVEILSSVLHWTPPKPCQHTTEWHFRWKHIDANNLKFTQIRGLGLWVAHTSSELVVVFFCGLLDVVSLLKEIVISSIFFMP